MMFILVKTIRSTINVKIMNSVTPTKIGAAITPNPSDDKMRFILKIKKTIIIGCPKRKGVILR